MKIDVTHERFKGIKENSEAIETINRWRKVLDAGRTPVLDEANAALCLEELQSFFQKNQQLGSIAPTIIIPVFRVLLSTINFHYTPTLKNSTPFNVSWSKEVDDEMQSSVYSMNFGSEFADVMRLEIEYQCLKISNDLKFNFEMEDKNIIFYIEPYDRSVVYIPKAIDADLSDSDWKKVGEE